MDGLTRERLAIRAARKLGSADGIGMLAGLFIRGELLAAEAIGMPLARRVQDATVRPPASLGCRPPAPEVVVPGAAMPPGNPGPTGSHQPPAAMLHEPSARTTRWGLVTARAAHPEPDPHRVVGACPIRRDIGEELLDRELAGHGTDNVPGFPAPRDGPP